MADIGAGRRRREPFNATIGRWIDVTDRLAVFRVRPDRGPAPPFEPGQYVLLGLPRDHPPVDEPDRFPAGDPRWKRLWRRPYTITSSARQREELELVANRVPGGRLTPRLWHAGEGGRVWLDAHIRGDFTLRPVPPDRDLLLVATGTGIAPYVSMLRTFRGTGRWRRVTLVHGVRHPQELLFRAELEAMAAADPTILYVPTCSRAAGAVWAGRRGRVQALLEPATYRRLVGADLEPDRCHIFLCGNPAMVDDGAADLESRGFVLHTASREGNLHVERYW